MNRKNGIFGIAVFLAAVIFILGGCVQPVETGDGSRDTFEKDSLLIEVWDSSTPPKFLGYYTGFAAEGYSNYSRPIILTSKGYCVQLRNRNNRICYGIIANTDFLPSDLYDEIQRTDGWGCAIFFDKANPTANDTPYGLWGSGNIINNVIYSPHNGGTYYTSDRNVTVPNIKIQANFKFYDNTGTMHTFNDDVEFGELRGISAEYLIGENFNECFLPLKKIGGYAELGLPDPATTAYPWVFKVK